ncbi:hypothetical protein TSA66_23875 [Noviherbaspirillum autotrophicum]|uniref:Uncharacterized protein n=1 Tax=Noviherbaspirillum autotrophicum TaxID=709839 RepID=A0A0C2BPF7_9BURK|nr:hypothetical protein TSA66_23875 [Noviherbaspirillum autotrophicum]
MIILKPSEQCVADKVLHSITSIIKALIPSECAPMPARPRLNAAPAAAAGLERLAHFADRFNAGSLDIILGCRLAQAAQRRVGTGSSRRKA